MKSSLEATGPEMARNIAYFAIYRLAKSEACGVAIDPLLRQTLERMLDHLSAQNNNFTSFLEQLKLNEENCSESLCNVFTEMLADRTLNWGRVLTIYCFSGCAAKYLLDQGCSKETANRIARTCGDFVSRELVTWIEEQGGWDKCRDHFGEKDKLEPFTWNGWHDLFRKGISAVSSAVSVR